MANDDNPEIVPIKDEAILPLNLPLSQNTINALTEDLDLENLDNVIVLSQGASQNSVGNVHASLAVSCFHQNKIVKNTPWIYSSTLRRLFMKPMEKVPILFQCQGNFDDEMNIVLSVRFEDLQFQNVPVEVCPNHMKQNERLNRTFPAHIIQYCSEKIVHYSQPPESDHYTVRFPVGPEAFGPGQTEFFQVSCSSSCMMVGRRRILICAELYYKNQVLSMVTVPVKISSSPLRDKQNEEAKTAIPRDGLQALCSSSKKMKKEDDGQQATEIVVRIKGRKNTEGVKKWLASNVSPNHYVIYSQMK